MTDAERAARNRILARLVRCTDQAECDEMERTLAAMPADVAPGRHSPPVAT